MLSLFIFSAESARRKYDKLGLPYLPVCDLDYYDNFSTFAKERWIPSRVQGLGQWKIDQTYPLQSRQGELALTTKNKEKTSIISTQFDAPIATEENETLVIQFEARSQFVYVCTSIFMRIFIHTPIELEKQTNESERYIEFGPQFCQGKTNANLQFYTKDKDGKTVEHKLAQNIRVPQDEITHQFTLILRPNNTFEYIVDTKSLYNGTYDRSFVPTLIEPEFIDDPNDKKPENWVDDEFIPDMNAVKPDNWNESEPEYVQSKRVRPPMGWLVHEPLEIPDPKDRKPEVWNNKISGEWKPRMIKNPRCKNAIGCGPYTPPMIKNKKYKGKWVRPMIKNPAFKGVWNPRQLPNPNYTGESFKMPPITGLSFNTWSQFQDVAIVSVSIGKDEHFIRRWDLEDFAHRQRRQIQKMKLSYNWINIDEEIEIPPEPGFFNMLNYQRHKIGRAWAKVENKSAVIAIIFAFVMVIGPLAWLIYELFFTEPFKEKYD